MTAKPAPTKRAWVGNVTGRPSGVIWTFHSPAVSRTFASTKPIPTDTATVAIATTAIGITSPRR